jgi:hypothetical protein
MSGYSFLIPDHIDPLDPIAGRKAAQQVLKTLDALLIAAQYTRQGGTVQEDIPLALLSDLDQALTAADNYHLFDVEGEAVQLAREMRKRILSGCQDAFAAHPSAEWRCLWDVYRELRGDCPAPWWGLAPQRGEMARDEQGLIGEATLFIPPAVQDHPWHPLAWPFIAAQFRSYDQSRLMELTSRLLAPPMQEATMADGAAAAGQPAAAPERDETTESGARSRMPVAKANERALKLARKLGKVFFVLSDTAQAKKIGCLIRTWRKTPFYSEAEKRRPKPVRKGQGRRRAVSLTEGIEATAGREDERLRQLIEERQADYEPSPLAPDPADRPRTVRERKRL